MHIYTNIVPTHMYMYIKMRCAQIRYRTFSKKSQIFEGGGLGAAEPPPGTRDEMCKRSTVCTWGAVWGAEPPPGT